MGRTRFPCLLLLLLLLAPAALSRTPVTTNDVPDKIFGHDEQKMDMSRLSPGTFFSFFFCESFHSSTSFSEGLHWITAGNIAKGLRLQEIDQVTVQVKVNLLLVGFNDEKDSPFSVNSDAFLGWFHHVEDSLRHTLLVPKGDGSVDAEKEPVFSKVVYDFKYQILQVSDIVNTVFEAAINTFMRPSSTPTLEYQVPSSLLPSPPQLSCSM